MSIVQKCYAMRFVLIKYISGVGLINAAEEIFEKPIREEIRPSLWTTNSFCTTSEWMYLCYHVQVKKISTVYKNINFTIVTRKSVHPFRSC